MNTLCEQFLLPVSPIAAFILTAILMILVQSIRREWCKPIITLLGMGGPIFSVLCTWYLSRLWPLAFAPLGFSGGPVWLNEFGHSYQLDSLSMGWFWAIGVFTFFSLIFIGSHFKDTDELGEVFILTHFIAAGMMLLVSSQSLLMVFVALELMSLPTYVLVGINRKSIISSEAALKYFLFGSFATVLLLLAIALIYAQTGSLYLNQIAGVLSTVGSENSTSNILGMASVLLFVVSIGFKIGIAPFHMWLPDVYQGAQTSVTGFMGSGIKLAGFGLALRIWWEMLLPLHQSWSGVIGALAVLTMFIGNIAALRQKDLKRLFAYSSISHAGYLFLGLTAVKSGVLPNSQAIYYYLVVYGFMFIGVFGILGLIENNSKSTDISKIANLGFSHPVLGVCFSIFVISAAGIPPTAGFLAKYFVFLEVVKTGGTFLVVLAVISSVIGVYYYLRILVSLYMTETTERLSFPAQDRVVMIGILACAVCVLYFAVFPFRLGI